MSARGNIPRDLERIAAVAIAAKAAGQPISEAVAAECDTTRRHATSLISRARAAGHPIPFDLPTRVQAGDAGATRRAVVGVGAHTITRAEYMARTANTDRPLTESGMVRMHQSETMRMMRGWR